MKRNNANFAMYAEVQAVLIAIGIVFTARIPSVPRNRHLSRGRIRPNSASEMSDESWGRRGYHEDNQKSHPSQTLRWRGCERHEEVNREA
jgi:hypothetical protein